MPLDQIVLGPTSDALVCGKEKHPIVVLKDGALDGTGDVMIQTQSICHLKEE